MFAALELRKKKAPATKATTLPLEVSMVVEFLASFMTLITQRVRVDDRSTVELFEPV